MVTSLNLKSIWALKSNPVPIYIVISVKTWGKRNETPVGKIGRVNHEVTLIKSCGSHVMEITVPEAKVYWDSGNLRGRHELKNPGQNLLGKIK